MSTAPAPAPTAASAVNTTAAAAAAAAAQPPNEEFLRSQLRKQFQSIKKREPLEPNYKRLLMNGVVTNRKPVLPKDKFYRRINSRLRERVERFCMENVGKDPFDRLRQRHKFEEEKMRASFTLREHKEHEQKPLLEAHLASLPKRSGMTEQAARRHLEGVAFGLQNVHWRRQQQQQQQAQAQADAPRSSVAAEQTEAARQAAELERQRKEAQAREHARRKRREEEEAERRERAEMEERRQQSTLTNNQALQRVYEPIFQMLWNLEFENLGGSNPFRMVIDRRNCAVVGAPDYFDIIEKPMNLTWIQQKVEHSEYNTLKDFFNDVELMVSNALKYNSDPSNPYHVAALELRRKFKERAKKTVQALRSRAGGSS